MMQRHKELYKHRSKMGYITCLCIRADERNVDNKEQETTKG